MDLLRLLHTIRPLRPVQIYGRLWFLLRPVRRAPGPAVERRALHGSWVAPVAVERSLFEASRVRLLHVEREIARAEDWSAPDADLLWLFNLHYFDDLRARDADLRQREQAAWIARWIAENPIGRGPGWHPYPTSLRIVNWIKWARAGAETPPGFDESLSAQAELLSRRLEHHLLGNHLLANAKALLFAGLFFSGEGAQRWLRIGSSLLARELDEQILADGGHFERSPMYHALVIEDLLDVINLVRAHESEQDAGLRALERNARATVARMLAWLARMTHPDEGLAFFNDCALGIAPTLRGLRAYAQRLGLSEIIVDRPEARPIEHLAASGFARLVSGAATLLMDIGEPGPAHLPGHAHAQILSFELSLAAQRVFVNSGVSVYGSAAERLRQRATLAHNTVCIDDQSSSEVWSGFRMGRRARPFELELGAQGEKLRIACSHDGYRRLRGRPVHRRSVELAPGLLSLEDTITGAFRMAVASYHFHPELRVTLDAKDAGRAWLGDQSVLRFELFGGRATLEASTWHPEFGISRPNSVVRLRFDGARAGLHASWEARA